MTELISSFSRIVSILIAFVGVLGTAYFVYGAYLLMMSGGNSQKAEQGKSAMIQAIVGIVLVVVAFGVVNTITSSIGDSGGAVQVGQIAGTDSTSLDQPRVINISEGNNCEGGSSKTCTLTITFSEPVTIVGTIALRIQNQGVAKIDESKNYDTNSSNTLEFIVNGTDGMSLPTGKYIADKFVFSRNARIRDQDNNNALYAFQEYEFTVN